MKYRKGLGKLSFRYSKGLSKYLEQTRLTADSSKYSGEKFSESCSVGVLKGYHFLWKVCERGTFSIKNGISKGKGLHLGAEHPCIKLC